MCLLFCKTEYSYFVLVSFNGIAEPVAVFPKTKQGQKAAEVIIDALSSVNNWPVEVL